MCLDCHHSTPAPGDLGVTAADVLHDPIERPAPAGQYRPTWHDVATVLQVRVMLERAGCPAGPITPHRDGVLILEQLVDPAATVATLEAAGWSANLEHGDAPTVWASR